MEARTAETEERPVGEWDRLFREVWAPLWRAVYVYSGGRRAFADEVAAEAFTKLFERWESVKDPRAWLYRVAFRLAKDELRREDRRIPPSLEPSTDDDEPEGVLAVVQALRQLPPKQRAAIVLHYRLDLPVREVAHVLGISVATAKVHLHRGRKRLRELLGSEEVADA